MDMKFTFSAQDLTQGLHVSLSGSGIVLTGFAHGKAISIEDAAGQVTVSVSSIEPVCSVAPQVSQVEPVPQDEALPEVPPVSQVQVLPEVQDSSAVHEAAQPQVSEVPFSDQLFADLATLRRQISSEVKLPPYMIFHDSTLREMCRVLPSHLSALKGITGVGASKLDKYGSRFLEIIQRYISEGQEVGA